MAKQLYDPASGTFSTVTALDQNTLYTNSGVSITSTLANERNRATTNSYGASVEEWRKTILTGYTTATDVVVSAVPALIRAVRVTGAAALVTAVTLKDGSVSQEVLAATSTIGTERNQFGAKWDGGITINIGGAASAGDQVTVWWRPQ